MATVKRLSLRKRAPVTSGYPSGYEEEFARFLGSDVQAFSFWKGRVALYAILKAFGVGPGDQVIVPGFTCVVVPNAVRLAGATPVYADILPDSYNVDPAAVAKAVTPHTKAILTQHTYGIPAPVDELAALASERSIYLVEDCAHAFGTVVQGRFVGLSGDAAFFSSQWSKPYTTGLGGLAVTRRDDLAQKLHAIQASFHLPPAKARFRLFVQYQIFQKFFTPRLYWQAQNILQSLGRLGLFVGSSSVSELEGEMPLDHEYLMADFQRRSGSPQLAKAILGLDHRRSLAEYYDHSLEAAGWPVAVRSLGTVLLRYPVRVANKDDLLEKARRAHVELGSWFETPLHPAPMKDHPVFFYTPGQCPNSEAAAHQTVNLPMHSRVTRAEAARVVHFFLSNAEIPS